MQHYYGSVMWVGAYLVGGLLFAATAATLPPPEEEAPQATTEPEPTGPGKFGDRCTSTEECGFRGSRCDNGACSCRPELPATNHFDKCGVEVDINGTCFFHEQCEMRVPQTECRDNRCSCRFEMKPALNKKNQIECIDLGKDVMRKWTNVRDSFQKNQRKRKEQSKFYERPTTESSLSSDDDQDEATPHTDEDKRKDDSIIEDGARKKMTDALEQELLQLIREKPDRNMFFFKGIIPSLQEFSEDEILEFQISVLNSIAALKEKRKKGLHHCLCKTPSGSQGQYNDFSSVEHGRNPCYHTIPQSRTVPASTMMETECRRTSCLNKIFGQRSRMDSLDSHEY